MFAGLRVGDVAEGGAGAPAGSFAAMGTEETDACQCEDDAEEEAWEEAYEDGGDGEFVAGFCEGGGGVQGGG